MSAYAMVFCNFVEDGCERADPDRTMIGNGYVMSSGFSGGYSYMAASLSCRFVSKYSKGFDELGSRQIARDPHAAITSSVTKWSRITEGFSAGSK